MKNKLFIILFSLGMFSCTEQVRAKQFGGTVTIELPKGKKLVDVTWKEANLWYLYTDMDENDTPKEYTFQEDSSFGVFEGKVIFKESK